MSEDICKRCQGAAKTGKHDPSVESVYGLFPGGEAWRFQPDREACSAEELARHAEAVKAGESRGASCATFGDGSAYTGGGYGIGVYVWGCVDCMDDEDRALFFGADASTKLAQRDDRDGATA